MRLQIGSELVLTLEMKKNNNDISRMTVIPVIFSSSPNLFKEICIWKIFFIFFYGMPKTGTAFLYGQTLKLYHWFLWGLNSQSVLPEKKSETEFLDTYNVYSIFPFLYKILISLIVCTYFYCQFSINENCEGQSS